MPLSLQEEIMFDICQEMFVKSIFSDLESGFLTILARKVKITLINPERILCKEGEHSGVMYFLIQGELTIRSSSNPEHICGILRPGVIVGETNLLFAYPNMLQIETRTVCQMLVLDRADIIDLLEQHPYSYYQLRERIQQVFEKMEADYSFIGKYPITWAVKRDGPKDQTPSCLIRRSTGFNRIVEGDLIDDTQETYIISMPCYDEQVYKDYTRVYRKSAIPHILIFDVYWLNIYNRFSLFSIFTLAIFYPFCFGFHGRTHYLDFQDLVCEGILESYSWVFLLLYLVDIFVEILMATPHTGIYYKFWDGLRIRKYKADFYIDLLCIIPVFESQYMNNLYIVPSVRSILKTLKVIRYFAYLENVNPHRLVFIRFLKCAVTFAYVFHWITCTILWLDAVVPTKKKGQELQETTWLDSYYVKYGDKLYQREVLREQAGYLFPSMFTVSMMGASGFTDFVGQSQREIMFIIVMEVLSVFLLSYFSAVMTSALACVVRPQLLFHQKLTGIKGYLEYLRVPSKLIKRVEEHYRLQYQLTSGVILAEKRRRLLYDAPRFLASDSVFFDNEILLDGVPLFSKASDDIIERISNLMRAYLIPPNITFVQKGEVRRQMYIIVKGQVGMIEDIEHYEQLMASNDPQKHRKIKYAALLDATGFFGISDLLAAEPSQYDVRTLTHVHLYTIDLSHVEEVFAEDELLKLIMDDEKARVQSALGAGDNFPAKKRDLKEVVPKVYSWINFPKDGQDMPHCTSKEFEEGFYGIRFAWAFRWMMRKTVHPRGLFSRCWIGFSSAISILTVISLFIEIFGSYRPIGLRVFQLVLDFLSWTDIFLKLHWAYFSKERKLLISHPVRTAIRYVWDGNFFYDLCFCTPYEMTIVLFGGTNFWGYGVGATWYSKLRWVRLFQIYRFRGIFRMLHRVFNGRINVLTGLYIVMTTVVSIVLGTVAIYMGCPWGPRDWKEGDQNKLPRCLRGHWATITPTFDQHPFSHRMILAVYYVSQAFFSVGFGDLIQLDQTELVFLLLVAVAGLSMLLYMIADITAAQVDSDVIRGRFTEKRERLVYIFNRERLSSSWIRAVSQHMKYTWSRSQGLQPKELFQDLHPALETELYKSIVGKKLQGIPIFQNLNDTIRGALCQILRKQYFLRGERLARVGNLENEMFVVLEGTLFVCDKYLNWKCSLEKGESFGEIAVLYGIPRKYSAIAATAMEVFALNAEEVAFLLDRYPVMKHRILAQLEDSMDDIFECKIPDDKDLHYNNNVSLFDYKEQAKLFTKEIQELVHDLELQSGVHGFDTEEEQIYIKSRFQRFKDSIAGWGTQDGRLPFLYFATDNAKKFKFLIHPNCGYVAWHNLFVLITWYLSPCIALYEFVFLSPEYWDIVVDDFVSEIIEIIGIILECFMFINILFQFIKPFEIDGGLYCKIYRKIAMHYVVTITLFLMDLISTFPFVWFLNSESTFLGLLKFLRLVQFYSAIIETKVDLDVSLFKYRLTLSLSAFFIASHILACVFYGIDCTVLSSSKVECESVSWVATYKDLYIQEGDDVSNRTILWYLRSLYFIMMTITTTGLGDITPVNFNECCIAVVGIILGAFGINVIIGSISTGLTSLSQARRTYFYNVKVIANHLSNVGLSQDREEMLLAYFILLWQQCHGVCIHEALEVLPLSMRIDGASLLFSGTVKKCKFFGTIADQSFIRNVCVRLSHAVYLPGLNIINEDKYGDSLYIVYKGSVAAYEMNINRGIPKFLKKYSANEAFGKVPALFHEASYNKSYRTEMKTEVLMLAQKDIKILARYYPQWKVYLTKIIETRYARLTKNMIHIFETDHGIEEELLRH